MSAFAVRRFERDGLAVVALDHPTSQSVVEVCPERGALVTRYAFGGREVLYLDYKTLVDRTASVRGGIPVLFPDPGRLTNERYRWNGPVVVEGKLAQHGFARKLPWRVESVVADDGGATLTLALRPSDETRAAFPWDFALAMRVTLSATGLDIAVDVTNRDARAMPFGWGWHPYFTLPHGQRGATSITTGARAFYDRLAERERPIGELDLTAPEIDVRLVGHGAPELPVRSPSNPFTVRTTGPLRQWILWLQPERDFFCVEPWSCPPDALNTGDDLVVLAPGASCTLGMAIVPGPLPR
jgi:galactose mutarotase-like enzyme